MPKAYLIARITVTDPERYADYVTGATQAIALHGGRLLARGGRFVELEGGSRPRNVVIEFDSLDQAQAYYASPEYQAAKAKREGAGIAEIIAVEGVD